MKKSIFNSLLFGFASSLAVGLVWAEESSSAALHAEQAYIRAMPPGQQVTAAFLRLVNSSDRACLITGGSSPIASDLQIHEHQHSNGMMKMRPLASVTVEAGQSLEFKPGQLHLMLFGIQETLVPGHPQTFSLTTENCGSLLVQAEVRSLFKNKPAASSHSHRGHNHKMHSEHDIQDSSK
jgi:periplasmic copper chaperone A